MATKFDGTRSVNREKDSSPTGGICPFPEFSGAMAPPPALFPLMVRVLAVWLFIVLFLPVGGSLAIAQPGSSPISNLVRNSSFELDADNDGLPDGWKRSGPENNPFLKPAAGRGLGGGKALFIEKGGRIEWETKIENINPGRYYLLTFWVKRFGWKDGEYPFLRVFGRTIRMNELFSWGGWRRASFVLRAGTRRETTLAFLGQELSHGIAFDHVVLREISFQLLSPIDNSVVKGGKPLFSWRIPVGNLVFRVVIDLTENPFFSDLSSRKDTKIELMSPQGNRVAFRKRLRKGIWYWRARAYLGKNEVARSPVRMFRVEGGDMGPLFRLQNEIRLNPRPSGPSPFLIGMWNARQKSFAELSRAGFNSIQSYGPVPEKRKVYVDAAARNGLRALISVPSALDRNRARHEPTLRSAASSPGILGWYMEDEPEGRGISPAQIWRRGRAVRRWNRRLLTALTVLRSRTAKYYGPAVDVVLVDPYPIPTQPLTWLSDSIDEVHLALGRDKPVWAIVQAFNWGGEPHYPKELQSRYPTFGEERALVYLSIVHRVRGIFFFEEGRARKNPEHWRGVKKIAAELRCMSPLLNSPASDSQPLLVSPVLDKKRKAAVHFLVKRLSGSGPPRSVLKCPALEKGRYLIAVNSASKDISAEFGGFTRVYNFATEIFKGRRQKITEGNLKEIFEPFGVRIWRLEDEKKKGG